MITHRIIKNRPRVEQPLPRVFEHNPNWPRPHLERQRIDFTPNRKFKTREEFETWYHNLPFSVGSIVTLSINEITTLGNVNLIVEANGDWSKIEWNNHTGWPKVFKIVQIREDGPGLSKDFVRWDGPNGYRELSKVEFERMVMPNRDLLQNYHKAYIRQPQSTD